MSCTEADRAWAEWFARQLEEQGYRIPVRTGDAPQSEVPEPERTFAVKSADWELPDPPAVSLIELGDLSPAAAELLAMLAWMAYAPVPVDLFVNHPGSLPAGLAVAARDPRSWAETVDTLARLGFVRRTPTEVLIGHQLLLQSVRTCGPCRSVEVQTLLEADVPSRIVATPADWPRWQALLSHVLAVADHVENDPARCAAENSGWLVDRAATYLQVRGRHADAIHLFKRALAIIEGVHGPGSLAAASTLNNLGESLFEQDLSAEAIPVLKRSLAIHERADGEQISVAINLDNLAKAYVGQRRHTEAIPLMARAITIWEAALGPDHPDLGVSLHNLASIHNQTKRYDEAIPLLERALAIDVSAYGPDDVTVATSLDALGMSLRGSGRLLESVSLFERALSIYDAVYPTGHRHVAICLRHLAGAFTDLGRHDDARNATARARAIDDGAAS
ncbi:tetratricopeptide repeat protein [Lentzea sp. NPDC051213]|uniref:tetratricopeptide repeat protein n=1 Tax=Lentzea sp. NPDC051213 TaxID=3364126 RepID=UPI0037B35B2D